MKRSVYLFILLITLAVATNKSYSQGFNLFVKGGYGIGADKSQYYSWAYSDLFFGPVSEQQFPMANTQEINGAETLITIQSVSYATGGRVGLGADYMITPYIGFGISGQYLLGQTISSELNTTADFIRSESSAQAFSLHPSVILAAGTEKINPFVRLGANFAFPKIKTTSERGIPTTLVLQDEVSGGTAFGFFGSLGAKYALSDLMDIFLEAEYSLMRYTPKTREIKSFTFNGVDILDMNYNYREIELSDDATFYEIKIEEKKQRSRIQPFSSLSFNLGLAFNLGRK